MNQEQRRQRLGMLCVAGSAILFASKGLFGKALYQRGVGFELLVMVRAVMAVPLFAWFAVRAMNQCPAGPRTWSQSAHAASAASSSRSHADIATDCVIDRI